MLRHLNTCQVFFTYSHLLESRRCLQVCWCSSGPGWRTRRRGPRGCPLLPCSPCNHQSHPWWRRRSWSSCQTGSLRTSCRMHAASHLPSDRGASPEKQIIYQLSIWSKRPRIYYVSLMRVLALGVRPEFLKTSKVFWKNEPRSSVIMSYIWRRSNEKGTNRTRKSTCLNPLTVHDVPERLSQEMEYTPVWKINQKNVMSDLLLTGMTGCKRYFLFHRRWTCYSFPWIWLIEPEAGFKKNKMTKPTKLGT